MGIVDILIILACLAAGYWIVSAIMGPGIDVMRAGREAEAKRSTPETVTVTRTLEDQRPVADWHIVLDIPRDASRRDIEAARKRRLAAAQSSGDSNMAERIQRAANAALRQAR